MQTLFVDLAEQGRISSSMKRNILRRGEVWTKRKFLVHDADPERAGMMWIFETDWFAVDQDFTGIRLKFTGQNINQGAFTSPVFPQERVDLAWMQDEIHALQRCGIAEAFTDAASGDDRRNVHFLSKPTSSRPDVHRFS